MAIVPFPSTCICLSSSSRTSPFYDLLSSLNNDFVPDMWLKQPLSKNHTILWFSVSCIGEWAVNSLLSSSTFSIKFACFYSSLFWSNSLLLCALFCCNICIGLNSCINMIYQIDLYLCRRRHDLVHEIHLCLCLGSWIFSLSFERRLPFHLKSLFLNLFK